MSGIQEAHTVNEIVAASRSSSGKAQSLLLGCDVG